MNEQSEVTYRDIRHVEETGDVLYAENMLSFGWQLLKVVTRRFEANEYPLYILGWPSAEPPQYAKKPARNFDFGVG